MSEPIAVLALKRKRDQISGTIEHYERLLREAQHDLANVNATLRLFEASGEARRSAALCGPKPRSEAGRDHADMHGSAGEGRSAGHAPACRAVKADVTYTELAKRLKNMGLRMRPRLP